MLFNRNTTFSTTFCLVLDYYQLCKCMSTVSLTMCSWQQQQTTFTITNTSLTTFAHNIKWQKLRDLLEQQRSWSHMKWSLTVLVIVVHSRYPFLSLGNVHPFRSCFSISIRQTLHFVCRLPCSAFPIDVSKIGSLVCYFLLADCRAHRVRDHRPHIVLGLPFLAPSVCLVHAPIGSCNPQHFRSS